MQVVYPSRRAALAVDRDQIVTGRARRSRKERDRLAVRFTNAQLEAEIEGRAPPNRRQRFFISREPLIFEDEPKPTPAAEPRISTLSLMMLAAAVVIAISAAVKGGLFDWRPTDRATSTIDHRLAPHLQPMKRTVK